MIRAYPVNGAFRPGAHYRASVWIKSASVTGIYANVAGQVLGGSGLSPEWKQFTREFTCSALSSQYVGLYNDSAAAGFFDDLVVEEIR